MTDQTNPLITPQLPDSSSEKPKEQLADWNEHEHVAANILVQAHQLLSEAGSLGLAQQAVESAARRQEVFSAEENAFAVQRGYSSYAELMETAVEVPSSTAVRWLVVTLATGKCLLWETHSLQSAQEYDSFEQACCSVPPPETST